MGNAVTIDSLQIELNSSAKGATSGLNSLSNTLGKLTTSTNKATMSYEKLYTKFKVWSAGVKTSIKIVNKFITASSDYVENLNLFTVSMGEFADEAKRYAEEIGDIMGIDPGEWMRNQGVFMTLTKGFGVAGDRANTMSKNLTQLGYDISSFFNISTEDAMQKLQSGIAGELEPLRRIGYDLSEARLELEAYNLGIKKKVSNMTQAEKAEIRYYAIMTQVTDAQGDMARTLDAPANQLRILKAQVTQATRSIGNLFIPTLNKILPVANAVLQIIRALADTIARLSGIEITTVDFEGASQTAGGISDSMKDASKSAKKLRDYTMGFDELNIINPNSDSSDIDSITGGGFDFELPEYDFISDATQTKVNEIVEKMKEWLGITDEIKSWADLLNTRLGDILIAIGSISAGLTLWRISSKFSKTLKNVRKEFEDISKTDALKKGIGLTLMITGFAFEGVGAYELGQGDTSFKNILQTLIGGALGIAGSLLVFGTGPLGWTVGIGLAITTFITGFTIGKWDKAKEDDLAKRFGDTILSDVDIQEMVSKLTTSELSLELKLFVSQQTALEDVKKSVDDVLEKLRLYNFKISMGLDVSKEDYQTSVDELVSSMEKYLEEKQVTATMSISILLDNSVIGDRLTTFTNEFYNKTKGELTNLGGQLKDTIAEGFVNGEWIPDKLQQAIELQKEIQAIYDYLSEVEYKAKLKALKLDASETDLSVTDFEKIMGEAQGIIEEQVKNLEGVRLEGLKVASMEFDQNILEGMSEIEATNIYNTTVAAIEEEFKNGKIELIADTYDFGIDIITERYSDEIEKTIPFFEQTTQELFTQGTGFVLPDETYDNVDILFSQLHDAFLFGLDDLDISNEARSNMKRLLDTLKPTTEEYQGIVEECLKAGKAVPENVSKGLNDINLLKAISGNMTSLNYLIGQHLSTDTEFLNLLATAEDAGKTIGEQVSNGLLANLTIVEDSANNTITLMNDTIGEKVIEVTPTLVQNLRDMGYNLSEGLLKGAEEKINADKKSWTDWAWLPWNWFKSTNEINSPSKLFARGGAFIAEGLFGGVDGGVSESEYFTIFERVANALDGVKINIKKIINTILGFIESLANGAIRGVNKVINALNNFNINVPDWVTELTGISDFGFNIPTLREITIPRLAEGAYGIPAGQVFIAREAGAEMVGSIGRRTTVANNDQIVAGITNGVAEANSEQNGLLREQNNLLRALLEKDTSVTLDGRKVSKELDRVNRERGVTLITGGAY